jgi:hypothetical protein
VGKNKFHKGGIVGVSEALVYTFYHDWQGRVFSQEEYEALLYYIGRWWERKDHMGWYQGLI